MHTSRTSTSAPRSPSPGSGVRDRIKDFRRIPAAQLLANPKNWRTHPAAQRRVLEDILVEVGYADALLARELPDGGLVLIDGHLRAETTPDAVVPVLVLDVTEEEADKLLLTVDPLAAMAESNNANLERLMREVRTQSDPITRMLGDLAKRAGVDLDSPAKEMKEDEGPRLEASDELLVKWGVKPGDLWIIGDHRLLCGDAAGAASMMRLMERELADAVVTDPPYGVSYASKNEFLNAIDHGTRVQSEIANDHESSADTKKLWVSVFSAVRKVLKPGGVYYMTGPQGPDLQQLLQSLVEADLKPRQMLVWVKNHHVLGRSDYNYRHEPIVYGWAPGAAHRFRGGTGETSVWEISKPRAAELHPTTKPVELFAKAIRNGTDARQIVLDPFLGSGTTMVASAQLGRRCYAIELEPRYVAVTLERMAVLGFAPHREGERSPIHDHVEVHPSSSSEQGVSDTEAAPSRNGGKRNVRGKL